MLDIVLLRLMKARKAFYQLYGVVPKDNASVDPQTLTILGDFFRYFEAYPTHLRVDRDTFMPWFTRWHPTLKPEQLAFFTQMLGSVFEQDVDQDQRGQIMQWLAQVELATKVANLTEQFSVGELDGDLFSEVVDLTDNYRKRLDVKFDTWIDDDIASLMENNNSTTGFHWRLQGLNDAMRPLQYGDFGIIAARPDKGKTSFIASECTFIAPQLPPDRNILWLNNEGPGRRIVPRLYMAALNMDEIQLRAAIQAGTAEKLYVQAVGRRDRIRVTDVHGKSNGQIAMIIEDHKADVVVYDMVDNVKGFGDAPRTDLALEHMYQWARELAVKYEHIALATSQISNDGDNQMYPTLGMLKDSKTGKQGACDFQLMIGAIDAPAMENARFLNLAKNKLRRPGGRPLRTEVHFDRDRSRFLDLPGTLPVEGLRLETHNPPSNSETPADGQPSPISGPIGEADLDAILNS